MKCAEVIKLGQENETLQNELKKHIRNLEILGSQEIG